MDIKYTCLNILDVSDVDLYNKHVMEGVTGRYQHAPLAGKATRSRIILVTNEVIILRSAMERPPPSPGEEIRVIYTLRLLGGKVHHDRAGSA